ncbi:MAG: chorismate synthase [Bacteroidales bacterium]|nr:chorismate synthase [Bacteroidales bacterium]
MSNTFGTRFKVTTYGESHGVAIGGVIDGCPAGLRYDDALMVSEMARRHEGKGATTRKEADIVEILSGIHNGYTLGTPIAFRIANGDVRSDDYTALENLYRPGHADYTYEARFGRRDYRGGGRASGRETATRVAAGAIAKMLLLTKGISINAAIAEVYEAETNDSAAGVIACSVDGVPAGLGDPVFDKLNARLAAAMLSIPSAIGFEIGAGFAAARMKGSQYRDNWKGDGSMATLTNHCGGIQGGISNGMPIVFRVAFHPVVTIGQPTQCVDKNGDLHTWQPQGRHDSNHLPRTVVVVEAMAALTLADFMVQTTHTL